MAIAINKTKKELNKIKKGLDEYFRHYEGYSFEFYIEETDRDFVLQVVDRTEEEDKDDGKYEVYEFVTENKSDDIQDIIKQLVSSIYEEEVNPRQKIVRGFKSFSKRKIKSLSVHMGKCNTDKIQEINKEMVNQYKLVERLQHEVNYFKMFVNALYSIKDKFQIKIQ